MFHVALWNLVFHIALWVSVSVSRCIVDLSQCFMLHCGTQSVFHVALWNFKAEQRSRSCRCWKIYLK